jgi:hypothetical protein
VYGKSFGKMVSGVVDARNWARGLVRMECRGAGDNENAMRRLERRYGIDWRIFWNTIYRPPADVTVGVYLTLRAAYEAECERQEGLFRNERERTKAKATAFASLVRAADAVAGTQDATGEG